MDDDTFRRLKEMDAALRELEMDGRLLEERIRSGQYSRSVGPSSEWLHVHSIKRTLGLFTYAE